MILLSLVYKVNSVRLCFNKNTAGRRVCLGRAGQGAWGRGYGGFGLFLRFGQNKPKMLEKVRLKMRIFC